MANAFIVRRGGGGGELKATDAILRVIAPAGSMVTISKGSISKSDQGHENASDPALYDYYFIIHASQFDSVNPWTVTATLGEDSADEKIIINSADEYDIVLSYYFYLIKDGNLIATLSYAGATAGAKSGDYWYFGTSDTGWHNAYIRMDVTDYSALIATIYPTASSTKYVGRWSQTAPTTSQDMAASTNMTSAPTDTESTYTFDLSSLVGTQTIGLRFGGLGSVFGVKDLALKKQRLTDIYRSGTEYVTMESVPLTSGQRLLADYTAHSDHFNLSTTGGNYSIARITSNPIDLTPYSYVVFIAKYSGNSSNTRVAQISSLKDPSNGSLVAYAAIGATSYTGYAVDVSALNDAYYISVGCSNNASTSNTQIDVTDIYLVHKEVTE